MDSDKAIEKFYNMLTNFAINHKIGVAVCAVLIFIFICILSYYYYLTDENFREFVRKWPYVLVFMGVFAPFGYFIHMQGLKNFKKIEIDIMNKFENWGAFVDSRISNEVSSIKKNVSDEVSNIKKNVKFIVHLSEMIDPFNRSCMEESRNIIFNGPKKVIYAIDWTPAGAWLSEDLLGYLAMQANWCASDSEREVHRIFVWDHIDNLERKMLAIHSMLGFHTYLANKEAVRKIAENKNHMRDVLFWDFPMKHDKNIDADADVRGVIINNIAIAGRVDEEIIGFRALNDPPGEMPRREQRKEHERIDAYKVMSAINVDEARGYARLFNSIKCCGAADNKGCLTGYFSSNYFSRNKLDLFEKSLSELEEVWAERQKKTA